MTDPRVAKLADLLVNYSLELEPGQIVRLDGGTVAAPFVRELYREALRAGANPRTRVEVEGIDVIAIGEASDEQLTFISEIDRLEIEKVDAIVTIWADRNTRALSQADPDACQQEDRVAPDADEPLLGADRRGRGEVGRHEVPHGRARAGRGDVARRVRGLRLRGVPRARRRGPRRALARGLRRAERARARARTRSPSCGSSGRTPTCASTSGVASGSRRTAS